MPIDYHVDHERRLVVARGKGEFTSADMFTYQRSAWADPAIAGYDELIDMTDVERIVASVPSNAMKQMSVEAAAQDPATNAGRLAIVAPSELAYGLGRQYQAYREMQPRATKSVGVFRTLVEGLLFLGQEALEGEWESDMGNRPATA